MSPDSMRILVVEDDADHAELVRRALARQSPGFQLTVVRDGQACLEALAGGDYALVLMDYSLPGMNGVEVLERIQELGVAVPVVMVTGQGDERVAVKAMKAGAVDYVVKTSGYTVTLPTVVGKALKQHQLMLENTRLYEETQRRLRETEALLELGRTLTSTLEFTPLLERVARRAARVCQMDRCAIYLWEQDKVVPVMCQLADGQADARLLQTFADLHEMRVEEVPLFAEAMVWHAPIVVSDTTRDPRVPPALRAVHSQTLLALPLVRQDDVVGVMVLDNMEPGPVAQSQIALGTAVASQVALAIDNARLYHDAQRALADLKTTQEHLVRGETLRALGELAGGVAHHLNNLLAVIAGRVEIVLPKPEAQPVRRPLEIIRRAAKDGAEVVRRIQTFARTKQVQEREPTDLNELVQEVVEMTRVRWRDAAQAQGVLIEVVHEAGSIPTVPGHAAALREVITNLVLNSVDALPSGGRITIKSWSEGNRVALAVADNGIGMSEDVLRRAQEPFFTTKGPRSTGLGLSVNYGIVQQHGGDMTIESTPGCGTTVTVRLPVEEAGAATGEAAAGPAVEPASLMVLVIDDEPEVREMLADLIETQGHIVMQAGGGREGLTRLEAGPVPDVVLTDLGMPEMTGWDVATTVKHRWPEVTVGLITGWGQDASGAPDARKAVDFILGKPVSGDELREKFVRVNSQPAAAKPRPAPTRPAGD